MLILSRKVGEEVIIEDTIRVMVTEIEGNKVRLGFDAPRSIEVHREEIWKEIEAEKARAS